MVGYDDAATQRVRERNSRREGDSVPQRMVLVAGAALTSARGKLEEAMSRRR
jgi:hypothetical protein